MWQAAAAFLIQLVLLVAPGSGAASPWGGASAFHPKTATLAVPYRDEWRHEEYVAQFDVHVDWVELRYHTASGMRTITSGMLVPVAYRPLPDAQPTLPLPRDALPGQPLELKITSEVSDPGMRILPERQLALEKAMRVRSFDLQLLLFAGFFIALALANLVLYASFRNSANLAYAGVMLSAAAIALRTSPDIVWGWLFRYASVPYVVIHDGTIMLYSVCLVAFTRAFLSTKKILPRYDRFLVTMYFLFVVLEVTAHEGLSSLRFGNVEFVDAVYVVFLAVPFIAGILALRAGSSVARFYLIALGGVFASLVIMDGLALLGHYYPLIIFFGMAWEGLWFMAALGVRVRDLDRAAIDLAREQAEAALHDSLTGLANRRKLEMDLQEASPPFELLYFDLDHFNVVNSTAGHEAGDAILEAVAARLDSFVRPGDTLARTGSDEFALMLLHRTVHGAQQIAGEMLSAIADVPFQRDHQTFSLTASSGCLIVSKPLAPSMLIALAGDASTSAKEQGRNRVYVTTADAAEEATRTAMQWVRRTSDALRDDRLTLFYQPIISLHDTSEPPRAEVLVRLVDEDGSIIEPSQFLASAEQYSLAANIDRWVIQHALPLVKPILDAGKLSGVSINLSGNALQDPDLDRFISAEIHNSGIKSSALTFEITETVVLAMLQQVRRLMTTLRRQNVSFALDDFGTGTSSLGMLRQLDVDVLKIDGSFVRDVATNSVDAAMVKTIHDLASALGLKTVAEYAKDYASVEKLREIGIDYAQGWAYAKPEPIEKLPAIEPIRFFDAAV